MVTGGGDGITAGPGLATKRRRRREQMEEEDSSDLSDESEEEGDQRAAQQIKFSKMPIRHRSGSSPLRSSNLRQSSTISPIRTTPARRGSQSQLEVVKERARRGLLLVVRFHQKMKLTRLHITDSARRHGTQLRRAKSYRTKQIPRSAYLGNRVLC